MKKLKDIVLKKGDKVYFSDGNMYDISHIHHSRNADEVFKDCIIIKIERPTQYETIYEAPKQILDQKEKKYLEAMIRPFRDRVRYIVKRSSILYAETRREYIVIHFGLSDDYFALPNFQRGTMYKGMELDQEYTLDELGLFKE